MEQAESKRSHMIKYLNLESYEQMQDQIKAQLHRTWRNDPNISIKQVQKALGFNNPQYYKELDRLGVDYPKKTSYKRKKKTSQPPKKLASSCAISFNGTYEPQELVNQLEGLHNMIDKNAHGYEFTITLNKITKE